MSGKATCTACPRACRLAEGQAGFCRARRNEGGAVRDASYGRLTSIAADPVEKKPLARWRPHSTVLSVGSYGCNLRCPFCQNHQIAQVGEDGARWQEVAPERLVDAAWRLHQEDARMAGIAFTYNEPLVGWEYVRDCSQLAHERGLATVLVSNGFTTDAVLDELLGAGADSGGCLIDAANIDLKGLSPAMGQACGYDPEAVFHAIARMVQAGVHVEATTLVVPGMNDSAEEIDEIAWRLDAIDSEMAYHVTRFFGRWKMAGAAPTPVEDVRKLADVARKRLSHVYVGNC